MNTADSIAPLAFAGLFILLAAAVVYRAWRGPRGLDADAPDGPDYGPVLLLFFAPLWTAGAGAVGNYIYYLAAQSLGQRTDFAISLGFTVLCAAALWIAILARARRTRRIGLPATLAAGAHLLGLLVCMIAALLILSARTPSAKSDAIGLFIVAIAAAGIAWLFAALHAAWRWDETPVPGLPYQPCGRCLYDLTGLPPTQMRCPECGAERNQDTGLETT